MPDLRITLIQSDIFWEESPKNLELFGRMIDDCRDPSDLIILPEMFNTGFSINPDRCAETMEGPSVSFLREKAEKKNCMMMGSLLISENNSYFNRLIAMFPDGSSVQYDKRHLFRLSDEYKVMSAGKKKIVAAWKNWKILPLVCYDLRFPVWSRNQWRGGEYEYDLLVYASNWPKSRSHIWKSLLVARAIENQCYVIGVNRIGKDGHGTAYSGNSLLIGPEGEILESADTEHPAVISTTLSMTRLMDFRKKYPFAPDWDHFTIHE